MSKLAVERAIWVAAPPERVWLAVTEPAQLNQWYATCCTWEIPSLKAGATVKFLNTPADVLSATIAVLDPPHEFTLRWDHDKTYPALQLVTSFLLTAENGGTRVTISESGYEASPADERQAWLDAAGLGYTGSLENLAALLAGQPLPHQ